MVNHAFWLYEDAGKGQSETDTQSIEQGVKSSWFVVEFQDVYSL